MSGTGSLGAQRERPGLYRVSASASLYLFLVYFAYATSFTPLSELFVGRACAKFGLSAENCKPQIDGKTNQKYSDAQEEAAGVSVLYTLLSGFPPIVTCALFGVLGDSYGRRLPLIIPISCGVFTALAFVVTNSSDAALLMLLPFTFGGGNYVSNLAAFSSLADVTRDSTPKQRTTVFGLVEAAIWLGLLIGPFVGGEAVSILGAQRAFLLPVALGIVNVFITLLSFPETLEKRRRRCFSWRRANPFASMNMFSKTRCTLLLGAILLVSLSAQSGGVAFLSVYALKVADLGPRHLGLLQSTVLGASVFGLVVAMPLLLRCISLQKIVALSCLNALVCWSLMSLVTLEWQLFAVGAGLLVAGCFFPVVRCGMTNYFGSERYGEALAAIGVVEQLCQMIGAPIVNGIYQRTLNLEFNIGRQSVHSVACLSVACLYLLGFLAALLLPQIPCESDVDGLPVNTAGLVSDCQDAPVTGFPRPV